MYRELLFKFRRHLCKGLLDDTISCYQLIITILIFLKRKCFISKKYTVTGMRELLQSQNEPRTHLLCAAHLFIRAWDKGFLAVLFNVIGNLEEAMKLRMLTVNCSMLQIY